MKRTSVALVLALPLCLMLTANALAGQSEDKKLIKAAKDGDLSVVQEMLAGGADINAKDSSGQTALTWSLDTKHYNRDIPRLLIEKGANIEAVDNLGETPLLDAATDGHLGVMKLLIDKGANINEQDGSGWTPLISAAYSCHRAAVRFLIEKGANVNIKNYNNKMTAIMTVGDKLEKGCPVGLNPDLTAIYRPLTPDEKERCEGVEGILKAAGAK